MLSGCWVSLVTVGCHGLQIINSKGESRGGMVLQSHAIFILGKLLGDKKSDKNINLIFFVFIVYIVYSRKSLD